MKPALLLVDFQNDFLDVPTLLPHRNHLIERAAHLLSGVRARGLPVVHVNTTTAGDGRGRMPHWERADRRLCVEGTPGHAAPPLLRPHRAEAVIPKQFFSAFSTGALSALLADLRVDTVLIAGVHLHGCVRATVLDAYAQGLQVLVAGDAVGSYDGLHAEVSRGYLHDRAARFLSVDDLLKLLAGEDGGAWVSQYSPRQLDHLRFSYPCGRAADAARAAREAWTRWRTSSMSARKAVLIRLADRLAGQAAELAEQMARDVGKPVAEGRGEIMGAAALLRSIVAATSAGYGSKRRRVRYLPLGVVAIITPWNNPWFIPIGKILAAVVYGNTVVWKPHPAASDVSLRLMQELHAAACPDGVVTLLLGDSATAWSLMNDAHVDAVTVTGGSLLGYAAQAVCNQRRIPLQAELGGNNPAIVWADADLRNAARQIARGAFGQAGQRCTANRRAVVDAACYDEFVGYLQEEGRALRWGDPLDDDTVVGPLVSAAQRDRVAAVVARACADGEHVIALHPDAPSVQGAYYPPTLVLCQDPHHEIVQEETFGPVLVVQRADDWEHALQLANGVPQGLVSSLFSSSRRRQERFLQEARAGILKINRSTDGAEPQLPFGGWKGSGLGPPEHGRSDREFYTRTQTLYHD